MAFVSNADAKKEVEGLQWTSDEDLSVSSLSSSRDTPEKTEEENKDEENSYRQTGATSFSASTVDESSSSLSSCTTASKDSVFGRRWKAVVEAINYPLRSGLLAVTHHAATNPKAYVVGTIIVSCAVLYAGLQTNFYFETSERRMWSPFNDQATIDYEWQSTLSTQNEFIYPPKLDNKLPADRYIENPEAILEPPPLPEGKYQEKTSISYIIYKTNTDDDNVVSLDGATRLFEVHQTVINTEGYKEHCEVFGGVTECPLPPENGLDFLCKAYDIPIGPGALTCKRNGATLFWLNSIEAFQERATTDEAVRETMSINTWPDGIEFNIRRVIGYPQYDEYNVLTYGKSLAGQFKIDSGISSRDLAAHIEGRLLDLRDHWSSDPQNPFRLQIFSDVMFTEELKRGIQKDIPLVPIAFAVMCLFSMLVYFKLQLWESQCMVAFGAVLSILLSLASGYGLLFCFGVPLTLLTQLLPFVMFGIGLDDAFVIMAAFRRSDPNKSPVERIQEGMEEASISICMTTMTSALAFTLGCMTSIPAVRWLCLYAFPTVLIDFWYQITFFVAIIVLDERWKKSRSLRLLSETKANKEHCDEEVPSEASKGLSKGQDRVCQVHFSERTMVVYSTFLMRPFVKAFVLMTFTVVFGLSIYSALQLEIFFEFTSILPQDSFLIDFNQAMFQYAEKRAASLSLYFRNIPEDSFEVLNHMDSYISDMLDKVDGISSPPLVYWGEGFRDFLETSNSTGLTLSFDDQIDLFLENDEYSQYRGSFVRDKGGAVIAAGTRINLDKIDLNDIKQVLTTYQQIIDVGNQQDLNQDGESSLVCVDDMFGLWAFVAATPKELVASSLYGILAAAICTAIFVPHWSATLLVTPLLAIVYVDLMGFLQAFGVSVNAISFVALTMSIGLLVDFLLHIVHRYFHCLVEGREAKTVEVLRTIGSAVLLGGLSTFLATLPLFFATNEIFHTIFVTFLGIVIIGMSHGLILLPVILSVIGPE